MAEKHTHIFFVCQKALKCWALVHLDNSVPELVLMANNFTTLLEPVEKSQLKSLGRNRFITLPYCSKSQKQSHQMELHRKSKAT
jgi:hypothetical protein